MRAHHTATVRAAFGAPLTLLSSAVDGGGVRTVSGGAAAGAVAAAAAVEAASTMVWGAWINAQAKRTPGTQARMVRRRVPRQIGVGQPLPLRGWVV